MTLAPGRRPTYEDAATAASFVSDNRVAPFWYNEVVNGRSGVIESLLLESCCDLPAEGGRVWVGCSTPDTGGYGLVTISSWPGIEVRMFGWDRLTPGSPCEHTPAIASLLRHTFVFDGADWVWRRPLTTAMVPVAAHLLARALADAWAIVPGADEKLLDVHAIQPGTDECECNRCLRPECAAHD